MERNGNQNRSDGNNPRGLTVQQLLEERALLRRQLQVVLQRRQLLQQQEDIARGLLQLTAQQQYELLEREFVRQREFTGQQRQPLTLEFTQQALQRARQQQQQELVQQQHELAQEQERLEQQLQGLALQERNMQ
ncbi:unnamed protein product [Arabis nemorensis]|uniref:Uncharacterized protein n=1 Tax=Arabis nemorensis TaxID=586526 RepID=A0A565C6J8_9BRAS|nr:unnamed protein product [Arabis nemorensis]